jgi:hypothetical protein
VTPGVLPSRGNHAPGQPIERARGKRVVGSAADVDPWC